ncbi:nitrogen regulation protein [Mariprofundus micogutta]|uniref:Nitrogen regulation protein n=1 Tax=Mariprofundus micogutta TaxID=1921010 RepID=A0A1L8CPW4_9PROT|nr:response regulator [Mariprofundus micogutta]GAV20869.1 nitrogen regulation protein [Mariprofundus micogutta]
MPIHIIDDKPEISEVLSLALEAHSEQIACFYSAEEYLAHTQSETYFEPKLLISDVRMGGMDGFELIRTLQRNGLKAKVIIMSGFHDRHELCHHNSCYFLDKPFNINELSSLVGKVIACDDCPTRCPVANLANTICHKV